MATTSIDREIAAPEKEYAIGSQPYDIYACPKCKHVLEPRSGDSLLPCLRVKLPSPRRDSRLHRAGPRTQHRLRPALIGKRDGSRGLDFLTASYETYIYPPVCNLFGGWHSTSLQELARSISDIVGPTSDVILDVACGPGTYGRRVASTSRAIYGIDISLSMLRQGARYVEREAL